MIQRVTPSARRRCIAIENWARHRYVAVIEDSWVEGAGVDLRGAWVFNQGGSRVSGGRLPDPAGRGGMHECGVGQAF